METWLLGLVVYAVFGQPVICISWIAAQRLSRILDSVLDEALNYSSELL